MGLKGVFYFNSEDFIDISFLMHSASVISICFSLVCMGVYGFFGWWVAVQKSIILCRGVFKFLMWFVSIYS